jgi:hypothetical protein
MLLRRGGRKRGISSRVAGSQLFRRLLSHPIVNPENNISIQGNPIGLETTMSALITTLKSRLFARVRPEDRVHALSVYSAMIFIALVVVSTFPHNHTF